ncbi:MAG TPA: C25 family cysteine peptidase [Candidatus Acidoferrum sp.]|nr:C25 family cysteine peptidase [Candidatus Acidoferrum sp.]
MQLEKTQLRNSKGFLAMCEAVLEQGYHVRMSAHGESMAPNIQDGDVVEISRAIGRNNRKGDIVLAKTSDGLKLHRIAETFEDGRAAVTRGDSGLECDLPASEFLGTAVSIERQGIGHSAFGAFARLSHFCNSMARRFKAAAGRRLKARKLFMTAFLIASIGIGIAGSAVPAAAQADLAVTADTVAPNPVAPGGTITYTVTVINNGPNTATTPTVTMAIPANTTFVSFTRTGGNGTWNCSGVAAGGTGTLACTRSANMANASTATFSIIVAVNTNTPGNTVIAQTVSIASSTTDPTPANNSASVNVTVNSADLGLTQTVSPSVVAPGSNVTYTLTLTNNGANGAANAVVYQQTPPNTTFVSVTVTPDAGGSWSCNTPVSTGQILCTDANNFPSGAVAKFTIVVNVNNTTAFGTVILNSADTTSTTADPNPTNNASTSSLLVENAADADLAVTMIASPTPVFISSNLTYTMVVQNLGLVDAANAKIVDTLPTGTTASSFTTTQGSCSGTTTVTCNFGTVTNGSSVTVTVSLTTPNNPGTLTNSATVSSTTTDPVASNNSATTMTVVQPLVCASPGKDGAGGTITGIVNAYYPPSAAGTAAAGATSVKLGAAAAGGAQTAIAINDLLLIIQMQDAAINSTNTSSYGHGTPGEPATGWTNLNNSGNFEFVTATNAVPVTGGTLNFTASGPTGGLLNTYTSAAYNAGVQGQRTYQVIRVPQYTSATLSSGLTAMSWNGATGGVLAVDVATQLTLGGTVVVDGLGFRGGGGQILTGGTGAATDYVTLAANGANASKGEGIAGTPEFVVNGAITTQAQTATDTGVEGYPNGSYARGAPGNAGGGATDADPAANDQNSGGGGGGNGGSGGQGGFGWNSAGIVGGFGGSAFPGTSSSMILGGGGGAGTTNNGSWWSDATQTGNNSCGANCTGIYSSGAPGGGIVIMHAGSITGTGTITANGATALDEENDGAGGGGAGGSIRVLANSGGLGGLTVIATGGNGGDTWPSQAPGTPFPGARHGAGGGGGGGAIFLSGAAAAAIVTGGSPGASTTALDPYGATVGAAGFTNTTYTITQTPGTQPGAYCASADLSVTNAGSPSVIVAGNNITYTQVVTNNGPSASVNAVFSEAIPANTNFQSITVPSGWSCTTPAVGASGNISCTNPFIANAGSSTFTVAVQVNGGTPNQTQITDTASVTSGTADPQLSNNSATVTTIVTAAGGADLTVNDTGSPNPVAAGQNVTFSHLVTNAGPSSASTISYSESVPANTTFVSLSTPAGWSCSTPAVGATGTITCTISTLAAGGSATFQPVFKVGAAVTSGTVITDTASINSVTADPNPNSNTASATVTVAGATQTDLAVSTSASPNPVLAGNNITFTQTVTNNGPLAAATDQFTETVPANTTFVSLGQPAGWVCTTPAVGGTGAITCNAVTMAANTTASFPLVVKVTAGTASGTVISNNPAVSSVTGDPISSNNSASASTVVASPSQADLSILKTASPQPVDQGTNLVYTLQIRNNGPATALGVTVSDPLPAQVSYNSVSTTQGTCSQSGGTVSCSLGSINVGGLAIVTINVTASTFSSATTATNTATVSATTGDPNLTNNSSTVVTTIQAPTAVQLVSFRVIPQENGTALIEWKTREEVRNLGFNVYREDQAGQHKLNASLIAGSALVLRGGRPQHAAKTYQWLDPAPFQAGANYWLEDVDLNGSKIQHGPAQIESALVTSATVSAAPLLVHLNELRPSTPGIVAAPVVRSSVLPTVDAALSRVRNSSVAGLPAVKISVKQEGWYRVTQPQLIAAGMDPRANARTLQLFAEGVEQPILIQGADTGSFGPNAAIEFYGTGVDTPFTDTRAYLLVWGNQLGKRIEMAPVARSVQEATSFPAAATIQDRTTYFAALLNGEDQDNFFGAIVTSAPVEQDLQISHLVAAGSAASLDVTLQGVTDQQTHSVSVTLNGTFVGSVNFSNQANCKSTFVFNPSLLIDGTNAVMLTAQDGDNDVSLVQSIVLHYPRAFVADSNLLSLDAAPGEHVTVTGFTNSSIRVFDVTDPLSVEQVQGRVNLSAQGASVDFVVPGAAWSGQPHVLLALSAVQVAAPSAVAFRPSPALLDREEGADVVIITHPDFAASLEPLVQLRRSQGHRVKVVSIDEIYDAFHYSERSPFAVRAFLQHAVTSWRIKPQSILLVGDASLDPRNYLGFGYFDFVPTRLIDTAALKTASDDWFTDFTQTGFGTIPIGRLPVRTAADANLVVAKIVSYESGQYAGDWTTQGLVVADGNIGADFSTTANAVAGTLQKSFSVTKILSNDLSQVAAKQQILDSINRGQVLVDYLGHGSVEQWSFNDLLDNQDATTLQNGNRLPVFLMMDCLNGFFQDVYTQSLAESLLLAPNGGGVAVWASSGFTDAGPQAGMNQSLIQILAVQPTLPLGQAILLAKSQTADRDVRRTWILFGDPSMKLGATSKPAAPKAFPRQVSTIPHRDLRQ